jgi:Protein  of unknown function (DUF3018)
VVTIVESKLAPVSETPYVSATEAVMGKHEIIKPSTSTERVRKHRAEMRAKGYKLKAVWMRDRNDPATLAEIAHTNAAIARWERDNPDELDWMRGFAARNWNSLPD